MTAPHAIPPRPPTTPPPAGRTRRRWPFVVAGGVILAVVVVVGGNMALDAANRERAEADAREETDGGDGSGAITCLDDAEVFTYQPGPQQAALVEAPMLYEFTLPVTVSNTGDVPVHFGTLQVRLDNGWLLTGSVGESTADSVELAPGSAIEVTASLQTLLSDLDAEEWQSDIVAITPRWSAPQGSITC